jgi:hypothetical protein
MTFDPDTAMRLIAEPRAAHGALRDARGLAAQQFQVGDVQVERHASALSTARWSDETRSKACRAALAQRDQLRTEVGRLTRQLKHVTYYEIHDDAITVLTERLETQAEGTPLAALASDAATNIRQLQQTNARAEAERDQLRAEVEAMHAVVLAASVFREALRDEDAECVVEHNALISAVDAYRARKP